MKRQAESLANGIPQADALRATQLALRERKKKRKNGDKGN